MVASRRSTQVLLMYLLVCAIKVEMDYLTRVRRGAKMRDTSHFRALSFRGNNLNKEEKCM